LSGCATILATGRDKLAISSTPVGSEVYVNGALMGVTPIELNLKADKSYVIEFRHKGYLPVTRTVDTKLGGGWLVLDIIFGCVPVIVDAATGNWNYLDQDAVNAVLVEQDK
jgi:hypothetical protein